MTGHVLVLGIVIGLLAGIPAWGLLGWAACYAVMAGRMLEDGDIGGRSR